MISSRVEFEPQSRTATLEVTDVNYLETRQHHFTRHQLTHGVVVAGEVVREVRVKTFDAHAGSAHSPAGLDGVGAHGGRLTPASVLLVGAREVLRVDKVLVAVHTARSLDTAHCFIEFGVDQPIHGGHRRAVAQMGLVLDHHRTSVTAPHDHGTSPVEGTPDQRFNGHEVVRRRVAKGQRQNSRVRTKRETKPCRPDDELAVLEVPLEGTTPEAGFTSGWNPGSVEFCATYPPPLPGKTWMRR